MSKAGFDNSPHPIGFIPSAPPSYDDAVAQPSMPMPMPTMSVPPVQSVPPIHQPVPVVQVAQQSPYPQQSYVVVNVGPRPCRLTCPNCNRQIKTQIKTEANKSAHLCCCLTCLLGCCLCSCLPYCLASFQNVNHSCPKCGAFIGTYRR